MAAPDSRFVRACKAMAVDRTPVWFMRQAGRYMAEYRAVRQKHSLIEICKNPQLAAEVTITAAEILNVDAAIIFADLLLPLEVMGLPFHFSAGEGPIIERPVRSHEDVARLRTDSAADLGYVSEGIRMYSQPGNWDELLRKLVLVTSECATAQVRAGADVIQVFDSWVGCLSVEDYRHYVLPRTSELVRNLKQSGAPVIYFGTDTATLLTSMKETGADVIGLDWRVPLDQGWSRLGNDGAVQGNLDPVVLFSAWKNVKLRAQEILDRAAARPGHIFNLGHGILPETPVENVKALAAYVQEYSAKAAREK